MPTENPSQPLGMASYKSWMGTVTYDELKAHLGHDVEIANYGSGEELTIECQDCGCILVFCPRPEPSRRAALVDLRELVADHPDEYPTGSYEALTNAIRKEPV